jgi:hypothetical protein
MNFFADVEALSHYIHSSCKAATKEVISCGWQVCPVFRIYSVRILSLFALRDFSIFPDECRNTALKYATVSFFLSLFQFLSSLKLCSWYSVVNPFHSTDEVSCVEALALLVWRPVYVVFEKIGK